MKREQIFRHAQRQQYFPTLAGLLCAVAMILSLVSSVSAQYEDWKYSGSIYILTTPEGADLPASALVKDFPLLIRLDKDFFEFTQVKSSGEDIRFSTPLGTELPYQIEQWNASEGTATIWVRIPIIKGNTRQEIKIH